MFIYLTWKKRFCQGFQNFTRYRSENNFVGTLKIMSNAAKNFDIRAIKCEQFSTLF